MAARGKETGRVSAQQNRAISYGFGGGVNVETLTGARTLAKALDAHYQKLDPGGASRDVTLPAEESSSGHWYVITNAADAAEDLVIKNDAAGTICTLNQNEATTVICDGSAWVTMGVVGISLT